MRLSELRELLADKDAREPRLDSDEMDKVLNDALALKKQHRILLKQEFHTHQKQHLNTASISTTNK